MAITPDLWKSVFSALLLGNLDDQAEVNAPREETYREPIGQDAHDGQALSQDAGSPAL